MTLSTLLLFGLPFGAFLLVSWLDGCYRVDTAEDRMASAALGFDVALVTAVATIALIVLNYTWFHWW